MKITFILPHARLEGGIRVVAIYAELLRQIGHEVFVVSWPAKPLRRRENLKLVISKNDNKVKEASHFDLYPYVPHKIIESRRPVVDADLPDADVVIATWWETAEWVSELAPNKGRKFYFIQGHEIFDYLHAEQVKETYQLPLHKITISAWLLDLMNQTYGDPDVSLVPNSVDAKQFWAPKRTKQRRPTVGLLYASLLGKGCELSFQAIDIVTKLIPDLKVVAFGSHLPDNALPLPEYVEFHHQPAQDKIRDIYAQCDVWLCASRTEGFHLPPLEAMACRCPVVSTIVGGPADIIKDGVNGYLVPQEDVDSLSSKLLHVLTLSLEDWLEMSDQAYKTATQYTWDDAASLFENALNSKLK
jgi:glycosyltransferase involved in cell wall biosynthesis